VERKWRGAQPLLLFGFPGVPAGLSAESFAPSSKLGGGALPRTTRKEEPVSRMPFPLTGDHHPGPSVTLAFDLPVLGISVPDAHQAAIFLRGVDIGAVDLVNVEADDIPAPGGNGHCVSQCVLIRGQMRGAVFTRRGFHYMV
jgi:hypothetical protein